MSKKAKEVYSYTDDKHEQDSRRMMEHINSMNAEYEAVEESKSQKQMEEREKMRLNAMGRYTLRCIATLLVAFALYKANAAGLIASVLAVPATYLCAIHLGWCWCKTVSLYKKGRGNR